MKRIVCLLLLLSLVVPSAAAAKQPDPWAPRQQCLFGMPYLGTAVMTQQRGLLNEIFKLLFESEDVLFQHVRMPYTKALESVVDGSVHMTLDVDTLVKGVVTGRHTLVTFDMAAAYRYDTGYTDVSSLAGKRVAYLNGFEIQRFLPVKVNAIPVYDLGSGFHQLDARRVDYLLGDIDLLKQAMFETQLPSGQIQMTFIKSMRVKPIFTDTEEGRLLRDIYDARMDEVIENGDLVELLRKEGMSEPDIAKVIEANK